MSNNAENLSAQRSPLSLEEAHENLLDRGTAVEDALIPTRLVGSASAKERRVLLTATLRLARAVLDVEEAEEAHERDAARLAARLAQHRRVS